MNRKVEGLLWSLRDSIHKALAESFDVASATAALEQAGQRPNFSVDVTLPQEQESVVAEIVPVIGPLVLTRSDEEFLRTVGISCGGLLSTCGTP